MQTSPARTRRVAPDPADLTSSYSKHTASRNARRSLPILQFPSTASMALFVHPCQGGLKALSQRIEHADVAFTMKQYVQTDLEADRQVANTLAGLIIGRSLTSFEISGTAREDQAATVGARARQAG
jgi:hypothetical protein